LGAVPIGDGRFVATEGKLFAATIDPTSAVSVRHAARAIDALDAQLHRAPIGVRDAAANSALRRAYETPRFHQTCAGTACVGAWVGEHIGSQVTHFLVWLFNHAPGSADLSTALTTMSILILFAALVGLGLLLRRGALRRMTVRVPRRDLNLPDEAIDDPDTMAASAYGAGELRTAYRYLFLATLLALQERGLLRLQPGWTNRDHLLTLRDAPQSTQDALRRMTDTFDRVWYGHESLDRATYDSLVTVSLSLRAGSQEAVA
jgi:hypothetical protein